MPLFRTIKNYVTAYLAQGALRFMSSDSQVVYMVLNCSPKRIAPRVMLPATDYVVHQIHKHLKLDSYGKTGKGQYNNTPISVVSSGIGGPMAAMVMEALKRAKVKYIIRVDYCGALSPDVMIGDIVLCTAAICGDGTTPHYLNTTNIVNKIEADPQLIAIIRNELKCHKIPFHEGMVWTHDALFREPLSLLENARSQGAIAIDMETSIVFTLGELFGIPTASILLVTDKPTGQDWDDQNIKISPKVFQNLDKVIDSVLTVLSELPD